MTLSQKLYRQIADLTIIRNGLLPDGVMNVRIGERVHELSRSIRILKKIAEEIEILDYINYYHVT